MKLYLVRHAQRGMGEDYDKLNWIGIEQAKRIGPFFRGKKIDFVYCSPQNRAKETLKFMKPYLKIKKDKILINNLFRQMSAPEEVGEEVIKRFNIKTDTEDMLEDRTLKILEFLKDKHKNDTILILSHKEVLKSLICKLFNFPPTEKIFIEKIASGSISYFELDSKFKVKKSLIGDITHLLTNPPYPLNKYRVSDIAGSHIVRAVIPKQLSKSVDWLNSTFETKQIEDSKQYSVYELELRKK